MMANKQGMSSGPQRHQGPLVRSRASDEALPSTSGTDQSIVHFISLWWPLQLILHTGYIQFFIALTLFCGRKTFIWHNKYFKIMIILCARIYTRYHTVMKTWKYQGINKGIIFFMEIKSHIFPVLPFTIESCLSGQSLQTLKEEVVNLIQSFPEGIEVSRLIFMYRRIYGKRFGPLSSYGLEGLQELFEELSDQVRVKRIYNKNMIKSVNPVHRTLQLPMFQGMNWKHCLNFLDCLYGVAESSDLDW